MAQQTTSTYRTATANATTPAIISVGVTCNVTWCVTVTTDDAGVDADADADAEAGTGIREGCKLRHAVAVAVNK